MNSKSLLRLLVICGALLSGPVSGSELDKGFTEPPAESGIRCFWWWLNSNVTAESITRDLEEMKDKGFSGALIFDADGSGQRKNKRVPAGPIFGSPDWTKLWIHACKEADRLSLALSLSIQSGWNLGGPSVTQEEASQHLVWTEHRIEGGGKVAQDFARPIQKDNFYRDVAVIAVPVVEGKRVPIDKLQQKNATRELGISAPDCRPLLNTKPAEPGEAVVQASKILDLSQHMDAKGKLTWEAPEGSWLVYRIGHAATQAHVSTSTEGSGGRVLDYLNPEMLDRYWKRHIDPLMKAIGPLAGTTVKYVHTDSWEGGGLNWSAGFEKEFRKRRGYDILPWLAVLTGHVVDSREDSNAFLADFRKTIGDLVANHYAELARLAAAYGMGTHPECSGPHAGPFDGLKNYGRSELMMSEFWSPSPHRPTPEARFFVKQASSAAHTYGKQLVGAEGMTTIGPHWNDIPWKTMKPSFDRELCAGLNLLFVHTFTASPKEMGVPGQEYFAGTHFNPQVTWWEEASSFIDYFRRCQFVTQRGKFIADVVHYYGDHIPNVFARKALDPGGALPGFDYDVLSEELLIGSLGVEDGVLVLPAGMRYRVLTLPDHQILSVGALQKIEKLVRNGATVLGPKPLKTVTLVEGADDFGKLADGLWGKGKMPDRGIRKVGKGRVAWGMRAAELLKSDGIKPDLEWSLSEGNASDIDWIHYRVGDADVYFIAEFSGQVSTHEFVFRIDGRIPEIWDPVDGSIHRATDYHIANGRSRLPLRLGRHGSCFVVFREAAGDRLSGEGFPNHIDWKSRQVIDGQWRVKFDPKWGGPEETLVFKDLIDWRDHEIPGVRNYSGMARYQTDFEVDAVSGREAIELGEVRGVGIARLKLNGKDLGTTWRPPFRVALGEALKPGKNELEIEVYNSWHNRVLADDALPEDQRFTQTNIQVQKTGRFAWKGEPSGLAGPVTLVVPER